MWAVKQEQRFWCCSNQVQRTKITAVWSVHRACQRKASVCTQRSASQDYHLLSQHSYFSAGQQPSASGASSHSGAMRNFSALGAELTLHACATEQSGKPRGMLQEVFMSVGIRHRLFAKYSFFSFIFSQYKVHILHVLIGSF